MSSQSSHLPVPIQKKQRKLRCGLQQDLPTLFSSFWYLLVKGTAFPVPWETRGPQWSWGHAEKEVHYRTGLSLSKGYPQDDKFRTTRIPTF